VNSDDKSIEVKYLGLASENIEAHKASTKVQPYIIGSMVLGKEYTYSELVDICGKAGFKKTSVYEGIKKMLKNNKLEKPRRDCYLLPK
jgi:hypothetical protein